MLEIKRLSKLNEELASENERLLDLGKRLRITSESALENNSKLLVNNELLEKQNKASTIVLNKQKEQIESLEQQLKRLIKR
jgi:hypothetical protein